MTAPLVPAEVDLRDFQYMELDVRVLRDSRFGAEVSGDAFRAGVMLWCASWHQVPCGSVPDDDIDLANLAGFGRFFKEWRKVREQALQGFVKCTDGRLYHRVVCEKARAAWDSKLQHFYERAKDRLRKANKARGLETPPRPPLLELSFDDWNARRLSGGIPMEKAEAFQGIPLATKPTDDGIPAENSLRGNGTERERNGESFKTSEPGGSAAAAGGDPHSAAGKPKVTDPDEIIFGYGVPLLTSAGSTDKHARSFLGGLRKAHGDAALVAMLRECVKAKPLQPMEWLAKALPPPDLPTGTDAAKAADKLAETARLLGFDRREIIDV